VQVESSEQLLEALQAGDIEVMVGRLLDCQDKSSFNYQRLADEPICAVARRGHALLERRDIHLRDLAAAPWIVPEVGTILRHRFDLMFLDAGYPSPNQVIEAVSPLVVTRLLEETNHLAVFARDVAEYYAAFKLISILPVSLSCNMDSFGMITRKDWSLSPAACVVCEALEEAVAKPKVTMPPARRAITVA
jgi:Transcriptional regulator